MQEVESACKQKYEFDLSKDSTLIFSELVRNFINMKRTHILVMIFSMKIVLITFRVNIRFSNIANILRKQVTCG